MRNDELYHYGILGMKWGVRRYQNEDGSWTNNGKARRRLGLNKKLTKQQKERIKKIAKGAAIGTVVVGGTVGGAILAKKFGPRAAKALKAGYIKNIKGPDMSYAEAVKKTKLNHDVIDILQRTKNRHSPDSQMFKDLNAMEKKYRSENRRLFETKVRTGSKTLFNKILRIPNDIENFNISPAGKASRDAALKDAYDKSLKTAGNVAGALGGGALAYGGAAAMDKLFDEQRDKKLARRTGVKYVKKPMNARAVDYMFPNPNRKK